MCRFAAPEPCWTVVSNCLLPLKVHFQVFVAFHTGFSKSVAHHSSFPPVLRSVQPVCKRFPYLGYQTPLNLLSLVSHHLILSHQQSIVVKTRHMRRQTRPINWTTLNLKRDRHIKESGTMSINFIFHFLHDNPQYKLH